MKAIAYLRVSTDKQAEQGVSLEAQEAKIRAMATVQGADLLEVITWKDDSWAYAGKATPWSMMSGQAAGSVRCGSTKFAVRSRSRPIRLLAKHITSGRVWQLITAV
jgi:hypothetical protein